MNIVSGALFGSRTVAEDLQNGIDGEVYEVNEMYPVFMEVAKSHKEYLAEISFKYDWEAEKTHARFYKKAKAVLKEEDLELGDIGVCNVCGYTIEEEIPERCPICKAKKDSFQIFAV